MKTKIQIDQVPGEYINDLPSYKIVYPQGVNHDLYYLYKESDEYDSNFIMMFDNLESFTEFMSNKQLLLGFSPFHLEVFHDEIYIEIDKTKTWIEVV